MGSVCTLNRVTSDLSALSTVSLQGCLFSFGVDSLLNDQRVSIKPIPIVVNVGSKLAHNLFGHVNR